MQDNHRKRHGNREALGTSLGQLSCFGIAGEIGGKIHTFTKKKQPSCNIAEKQSKNTEDQGNKDGSSTSIEVGMFQLVIKNKLFSLNNKTILLLIQFSNELNEADDTLLDLSHKSSDHTQPHSIIVKQQQQDQLIIYRKEH